VARGARLCSERPSAPAATAAARPRAIYLILTIVVAVYGFELLFPISAGVLGSPSVLTLAYDGGMLGERIIEENEWWRFFTAPLLHASPSHILFNGIVLWIAGTALEAMIGWRWLCGIFAISALCGAVASFAFLPLETVGVGASGAIMGLLAATFVVSLRLPPGRPRTSLQLRMGQTIVPALLPFFSNPSGEAIDYLAHAGGTAGGAGIAAILLVLWPRDRAEPRFGWGGAIAGAAFFAVAAGSLIPILQLRATP
jgi:rhomboid protease GluP